MRVKPVVIAIVAIAASVLVGLKAMDWLAPVKTTPAPALAALPALPAVSRSSSIIAPIEIPLQAIAASADRAAPRNLAGTADNPIPEILQNADLNWTAVRGPITATGVRNALSLATPLSGKLHIRGSLSDNARGALGDALGSLLGGNVARQIGSLNIRNINADAEIRGSVSMTSRPALTAKWRIEPNLTAQVNLGDTSLSVAGVRVNVPGQLKPAIDHAVNDQLVSLQQRIRNNPAIEQNARREWAKMCRSIPLQTASAPPPHLWLELRPTRAVAAQPRIDGRAMTLTLGIGAETRVTSTETKPDCPFPETLDIIAATPGRISIAVPIDLPFTDINKILNAQLAGRTFPEDGNGAVAIKVKSATVAASGDRLLFSLLVDASEKRSWFGLGAGATVHIWGRPVLDKTNQTLRLTDLKLAVESEAGFGLLGAASQAAAPWLEKALAEKAIIDLKPFAASVREQIGPVVRGFQKNDAGVRVNAEITSLRLADIAFDSTRLRVIAEADGAARVTVNALPGW